MSVTGNSWRGYANAYASPHKIQASQSCTQSSDRKREGGTPSHAINKVEIPTLGAERVWCRGNRPLERSLL
ncbi:hypothetical protein [Nostoc sp.]|uniref:hypothetical protein n=1 Tax=Nostoc sp. TaxID=1180 RepID=UPI002FF91248